VVDEAAVVARAGPGVGRRVRRIQPRSKMSLLPHEGRIAQREEKCQTSSLRDLAEPRAARGLANIVSFEKVEPVSEEAPVA